MTAATQMANLDQAKHDRREALEVSQDTDLLI